MNDPGRTISNSSGVAEKIWSVRFLLFIAGLGGLLYGIDVGIIAGALKYLEATAVLEWKLNAQQLSFIVAAVLLGSTLSSLFAGMLSDLVGRRTMMFVSGLLFVISIPVIALASGYMPLLLGRLLQGISGGFIAVVVPLYLAECLPAKDRGRGTGIFQWLLTLGIVVAALIGLYYARSVEGVEEAAKHLASVDDAAKAISQAKDDAWRHIFWISIAPGIVFTLGSLGLVESARWLFRRGKTEAALAALLRTRSAAEADLEMREMQETAHAADKKTQAAKADGGDSLFSRKYILPFVIACIVLACTQATGVNSILAYVVNILNQAGLPGSVANWGDVSLKTLNFLMTIVAVILVDRKGRKFLLMLGSAGIVVCLAAAGALFMSAEQDRADCQQFFQALVKHDKLEVTIDDDLLIRAMRATNRSAAAEPAEGRHMQLTLVYSYGPFTNVQSRRGDDSIKLLTIENPTPKDDGNAKQPEQSGVAKLLRAIHLDPTPDPAQVKDAPLEIKKAMIGPVPSETHGWLVAICLFGFMAFFAVGPGVCVWLALSELMPTRIRSNGMSIAMLINQLVSATIAAVFLPTVGNYGYAAMFFFWSGCTVVYFLTATFLLPETKGKTLEEIEEHFSGQKV